MTEILIAREHDRSALRQALTRQQLERLRRGAYRPAAASRASDAGRRHVRACARIRPSTGSSPHHASSATSLLHGSPIWTVPTSVHIVQGYAPSSGAARDLTRHRLDLAKDEVVTIRGMRVTSLARTTLDCATTLPALDALVIADWMLGNGLDRDDALDRLAARSDRRGTRRAAAVLAVADAGAQSAWETWMRYVLLAAGLPPPRTQVLVTTRLGACWVDVGWPEWRLLLEFDGFVKYRDGVLGPGYDADRARFAEKRREDAIRETGAQLLRVTAKDTAADVLGRVLARVPAEVSRALRRNPLFPAP